MHISRKTGRVLVLGATGRIGTILRKCWPQDGPQDGPRGQALGQALWQARSRSAGSGGSGRRGAGWIVVDPLRQPEALARAARGCAAILCLAGVVPGRVRNGVQETGLNDNAALAEAAVRAGGAVGARVLLASSAAVYGNRPGGPDAGGLAESAGLTPVSDYGRAKVEMEARGADLAADLGVEVCALRIGNIAGLDAILGGWQPGFRLDRFADGRTPQRSYIGVATLARVLGDLLAVPDWPAALNIAGPGVVEMGALLDAAGLAWTPRPAPQGAIAQVRLSTGALAGFTKLPETTTAAGLVAEWHAVQTMKASPP